VDVLLATDRIDLRIDLELLLREEPGVRVVGAASEAAGLLALIGTAHPDVVVFDWDLPGHPPGQLIAAIRELDPRSKLLVGVETAELEQVALAAGADAVLIHGDPPAQFLAAMRQFSGRARRPV
jgi:DNA-binding NarL/FixJ family response regulator